MFSASKLTNLGEVGLPDFWSLRKDALCFLLSPSHPLRGRRAAL
jgi:hypothetical protein